MPVQSNNKTIARNTVYLYFRMMFTMVVSLYTSRVILQVLGVDDFGIYQTVGGIVGLLSFLNSALAAGSSRFLTYELGTGDKEKLKKTFSTVLSAHILIALGVAAIAETVGLWFVCNKLVIPEERFGAALFTYHFSVLTAVIQLTQVPYNASIISHEKMSVYAYASIVDVCLKLLIVYFLVLGEYDKLMLYAVLHFAITFFMAMFYRIYCIRKFEETRYKMMINKAIMKDVMGYSGWNLFANTALALNNHGAVLLLNMFFSPGVVTARAIANQVNMAAYHFVTNFRTAANPQIVKRYASGDYDGSKNLLLSSTKYSFYMMLLLALPIVLIAEPLLKLWLGQVPPFSVIFLQLTIVCSLFQVFDTSFYVALYAKGQIRENALVSPTILMISFPVVYFMFKKGYSPEVYAWASLICYALLGLLVKPILLVRIVGYSFDDIMQIFIPCAKVGIVSIIIPLLLNYYLYITNITVTIFSSLLLIGVSLLSVGVSVWFWGIDSDIRTKLIETVTKKWDHFCP